MADDPELLRRYSQEHSEEAFAEVVRRHLGLVYHAALRQAGGDAHMAEEAAEDVFIDMGRKAAMLAKRPALAGWLYVSACYATAKRVRSAQRRRGWEKEAMIMQELSAPDAEIEWSRIRPALDELMLRLGERDREALLLRYFEGLRFSEMGQKLRLTEDGARLRVDRALEKLRRMLARRGIVSTGTALAAALASQTGVAAPVGLAGSLASAALGKIGAAKGLTTTGFVIWEFMTGSKMAMGVVAAVLLLAAGSAYRLARYTHYSPASASLEAGSENGLETGKTAAIAKTTPAAAAPAIIPSGKDGSGGHASPDVAAPGGGNTPVVPNLVGGSIPIRSLSNVGFATPQAAFETIVWATAHGTNDDIARLLVLSPSQKGKLDAILARQPDATRAEYPDAEHFFAVDAALQGTVVPADGSILITSETAKDAGDISITFHMQTDHRF